MNRNIGLTGIAILLMVAAAAQNKPASKTQQQPSIKTSIAAGKLVYTQYCLSCHMADGGGVQNMNPPLIKTSFVNGDKAKLISVVLNGMSRQEIDGETYNNVMAPFNYFTDQQIADVLTYVRNSFGNKKTAVTVAEVKKVRAKK